MYSRPVNEALYAEAFTAVHPANVRTQANVRFPEPFTASPNMPHFPPVRYPTLTDCPLENPQDVSLRMMMLMQTVAKTSADDPVPMETDGFGSARVVPTLVLSADALSANELYKRAFVPQTTLAVVTGWD